MKTAEPVPEATILEPPIAKTSGISIIEAIRKGNIEAVKQHLAAGMDVNGRDNWGRTVLHKASGWQGQREIVELLISNGADVNAKRSDGAIPLHYAVYYDRMENVEILLSKGADLNAKDGDQKGATPLHEAAWRSREEIVDLL
ncbi:MAG: ankyrin repeat domain-containing protein, partial [Planctomycetota bacterium]|nr:ankyrin repeat domain-containing protein [Planctomycetota bacterium]